jgi:hypothetical protein
MAITWNPSDKSANVTLSGGNLIATWGSGTAGVRATSPITAATKVYFENTIGTSNANQFIGIGNASMPLNILIGTDNNSVGYQSVGGQVFLNNVVIGALAACGAGDVVCVAVDLTNSKIWFRKNGGLWNLSGTDNPATNTGGYSISGLAAGPYFPAWAANASNSATVNFGATAYAFTAPSGFGNVGNVTLTASNLTTSSPALGSPAVSQVHALAATNLTTSSPVIGTPILATLLFPQGLTVGSPVIGSPGLVAGRVLALPVSSRVVTAYPVAL